MASIYNGTPYLKARNENSVYKVPQYGTQFKQKETDRKDILTKNILDITEDEELDLLANARTSERLDAMSQGVEDIIDPKGVEDKNPSLIKSANIATGISTAANVATSIYGAIQASKMKPTLSSYQAPIESVLISDNTNAIQSAGKENIDKSINTARASNQRNGLVGMDGVLLSKENEGLNQLSASLAQYRQGIDSANAQIQNQTNQYNQSNESNRNQFNAQTQNQFDQYKSGLIGMAMKNATDNLSAGVGSIFKNLSQSSQIQLMSVESEIESLLNEPNGSVLNAPRIETLQKESKAIRESIYGNKIYNT